MHHAVPVQQLYPKIDSIKISQQLFIHAWLVKLKDKASVMNGDIAKLYMQPREANINKVRKNAAKIMGALWVGMYYMTLKGNHKKLHWFSQRKKYRFALEILERSGEKVIPQHFIHRIEKFAASIGRTKGEFRTHLKNIRKTEEELHKDLDQNLKEKKISSDEHRQILLNRDTSKDIESLIHLLQKAIERIHHQTQQGEALYRQILIDNRSLELVADIQGRIKSLEKYKNTLITNSNPNKDQRTTIYQLENILKNIDNLMIRLFEDLKQLDHLLEVAA